LYRKKAERGLLGGAGYLTKKSIQDQFSDQDKNKLKSYFVFFGLDHLECLVFFLLVSFDFFNLLFYSQGKESLNFNIILQLPSLPAYQNLLFDWIISIPNPFIPPNLFFS